MKKIFILILSFLATTGVVLASESTGTIDTGVSTGIDISLPCSPASVTNGTVNVNTCVITCNSGYTLSGTSCNRSGGGGGGGSGGGESTINTAYTLPTTESTTVLSLSRSVDLSTVDGVLPRPLELSDPTNSALKIEISKDTKITTTDGKAFTGTLSVPKLVAPGSVPAPLGNVLILGAMTVGSDTTRLVFSKPVTITIPITIPAGTDPASFKVFYFDTATNSYKLAGDGGKLSADKKTMVVEVMHFTTFAVLTSTQSEVAVKVTLTDLDSKEWYYPFVMKLISWSSISGYPDQTFRPANTVNRAEFAKMVALTFDLDLPTIISESPFTDVPKDAWYTKYALACKNAVVINGYADGTFRPEQAINRAEALKMVLLAAKYTLSTATTTSFSDVPATEWYAAFVKFAVDKGIVNGYADQTFKPGNNLTRAEAAKIIVNAKEKK